MIGQIRTRTEKFKSTFYPHCWSEWNVLETETRLAASVAIFQKKMLGSRPGGGGGGGGVTPPKFVRGCAHEKKFFHLAPEFLPSDDTLF